MVDAAEKEQRRTTRLGAIIAIVAVIGTLCAFLFKMTISSLNVWSEQGVMYWYLQALFSFALSTSVIIFIDIVLYVISDLKGTIRWIKIISSMIRIRQQIHVLTK